MGVRACLVDARVLDGKQRLGDGKEHWVHAVAGRAALTGMHLVSEHASGAFILCATRWRRERMLD